MITNTFANFQEVVAKNKYYRKRWGYLSKVIEIASLLNPTTALEIGAYQFPVFLDADTIDIKPANNPTFIQDITKVPWDKQIGTYDLIIALQIFEHLKGKQSVAFIETLKHTNKFILLSIPYKWENSIDPGHVGLDESTLLEWTRIQPIKSFVIDQRLINLYQK